MNDVPNINQLGAAKPSNINKFRGSRVSERGGSNLANSLEMIYVYVFFFSVPTSSKESQSLLCGSGTWQRNGGDQKGQIPEGKTALNNSADRRKGASRKGPGQTTSKSVEEHCGHFSRDWSEYVNVIGVISEPFAREFR